MVQNFYDLEIWKESHRLGVEIYRNTEDFPAKEQFDMTNQLRRVASSISANIAEGFGRYHYKDKIKFCYHFVIKREVRVVRYKIFFFCPKTYIIYQKKKLSHL